MARWVHLCSKNEVPAAEQVRTCYAEGRAFCVANHAGRLSVLDNRCPHRDGPLGEGWIEGDSVLCPYHAWGFNLQTGVVDPPERGSVQVYEVREEGDGIEVLME